MTYSEKIKFAMLEASNTAKLASNRAAIAATQQRTVRAFNRMLRDLRK